ncbi:MAG TPA: hypothetical protein VK179_10760 [Bacteroidales bacterium]|nr:hypothetical protein [Bacteroidales bacterium]
MNIKQNPFSLYDFLGYFIPGATGIYLYILILQLYSYNEIEISSVLNGLNLESVGYYLPFIIGSYILGHILSFISSISVEKYSVWKYGYPSKFLLKMNHDGFWGKRELKRQKVWRILVVFLIYPVFIFDLFVGNLLKAKDIYTKQLDDFLIKIIREKKKALINHLGYRGLEEFGDVSNIDFYRIILHYTYEHSKTHQNKMYNYVALYGFHRTLCFLAIILHWCIICRGIVFVDFFSLKSQILLLFSGALSYIFFMGFMKFYRRYTLEGFMTLVSLENYSDSNDIKKGESTL